MRDRRGLVSLLGMDNPTVRSVENPRVVAAARGQRKDVVDCPIAVGAGQWCYDRLASKRSPSKLRIEASFFNASHQTRITEFQKLVDLLKADSLLMCAFAAASYDTFTLTFKDGSAIVFE